MWLLAFWIFIAALGVAASLTTLRQSVIFSRYLRRNDNTKQLVYAYRIEILRDVISVSVQSINLLIGLLATITYGHHPNSVIGVITTIGFMSVAVLLMALSLVNYRIRHHKDT